MLLNQETLRLVFGLKLKGLRLDRNLSLKELSKKTGLSPSYLNEIEKGKKYPRTEKILLLAEALNERIEDLISLELKKELHLLQQLIDKKVFTGIPFDIFGVPAGTIFDLIAEHPKKLQALVGTLLELARAHSIDVDDLLFALLSAYLDMHNNYFPSIEEKARKTQHDFKIDVHAPATEVRQKLITILQDNCKVKVLDKQDFSTISPEFNELDFFVTQNGQTLYISKDLSIKEEILILAREIGYNRLKLKTRPTTSLIVQLDSFEQLFNHFSTSYFASSLLVPEIEITRNIEVMFSKKQFSVHEFQQLIESYHLPVESFYHRMTQVLPKNFDISKLFFLRYEFDLKTKKYQVARELHLSPSESPHKLKGHEHYCARWVAHKLTMQAQTSKEAATHGIQRSTFMSSDNEYIIIATAYLHPQGEGKISCVCLGLLNHDNLDKKVQFFNNPEIVNLKVGQTCERCSLTDCNERLAAFEPSLNPLRYNQILQKIQTLN